MKTTILSLLLLISISGFGQTLAKVASLIEKELSSNKLPALAVAVIDSGKVVHLSANGYKDLEKKIEADIYTPFQIASVSKTVTNLAIFKLVESGNIELHSDINQYLPFEIKNPFYPNDFITVRDLLNHRSGIRDDYEIYADLWRIPQGDSKIDMGEFLRDYLNKDGKLYKETHFGSETDYKSFRYCNTGVALLGLIVEKVSGLSFEEFCQKNIFQPLAMKHTSWFLKHLDSEQVAKPYIYQDSTGLQFKGHNGYPDYPAGQLRTSISDYSKLLTGYLNAGNSQFILSEATVKQITPSPQISHEGYYTWFLNAMGNHLYYSHEGGDTGVRTVAMMDVNNKNAIVIFANAEHRLGTLLRGIEKEMWGK